MEVVTYMRARTANVDGRLGRVAVLAYPRLSMFEFSAACEVFGPNAADSLGEPWYDFVVCGGVPEVRCDNTLTMSGPGRFGATRRANIIVLPPYRDPAAVSDAKLRAVTTAHTHAEPGSSRCVPAPSCSRAPACSTDDAP